MRLSYCAEIPGSYPAVLIREQHQVELFIRPCGELWLLVGLSGEAGRPANSHKLQGPYQLREEVEAACRAIADALRHRGYEPSDRHASWELQARLYAQRVVDQRRQGVVDTRFNPDTDLY